MRVAGTRDAERAALLVELGSIAAKRGWIVASEAVSDGFLGRIVWRLVRKLGLAPESESSPGANPGANSGMDPDDEMGAGAGDPPFGDLNSWGRTNILRDLIRLAAERSGILITLDDVRESRIEEIAVVAVAVQHAIREDLDVALVLAGRPAEIDRVVNGKAISFLLRAVPFDLDSFDATASEVASKE